MEKKKIIVLSVLGLILLGIIFIPGYLKIKRLAGQNRELERQIKETRQANRKLGEEQKKLESDPVYLEEVLREKLGLAKEGEIIYKVLPPQQNQ
ncbi:MAG: septum formation initiator family protein [Candidatus Omnitrophica bacterium]|nr:septum formation initiator family protein [Candidatus Omnitrophota bacterium]MBU3934198.1 septum formation initiator family protein [Candidatus Omnitrophota bacterium]